MAAPAEKSKLELWLPFVSENLGCLLIVFMIVVGVALVLAGVVAFEEVGEWTVEALRAVRGREN